MEAVLFEDRFAPITEAIGFLRASLDEVVEALRLWRIRIHGSVEVVSLDGGLLANVGRLEPLTTRVRPRELLVQTRDPDWTAFFDCGLRGGDPIASIGYLASTVLRQGVVVASIPDRRGGRRTGLPERYGAREFQLFGPLQMHFLNYVRGIAVVRNGARWQFNATGTVQDFEDLEVYGRRTIADRFTSSMLIDYARAVGLDAFNPDFYLGPSALVVNPARSPAGSWVMSLADTRRSTGIDLADQ